jgi:serine/threonine protein phosphatase PrpC
VAAGDTYCEACGEALAPETSVGPRASDATTCPSCGAPGADATPDGYCSHCGRRWSPIREHDELVDGPVAAVTDRGVDHWRNEDAVGICAAGGGFALVVCDGVSISQEPHVVSQAAVDAAVPVLREALARSFDLEQAMVDAATEAQKAAAAVPHDPAQDLGPGACTFVAAAVRDDVLVVGSVGDSRAYWADLTGIVQVSQDDSLAADMIASGGMTASQGVAGTSGHAITKWLGVDSTDPAPTITRLPLLGAGLVLVVSDGLWNYAPEPDDLARLVGRPGDEPALDLARRLVAFAEESGGADNVTVAVGPYRDQEEWD